MNLLPKDDRFFTLFREHTAMLCHASQLLNEGLKQHATEESGYAFRALEEQGDRLLQQTMNHLHETFLTPFEPEDVRKLSRSLDDVLDSIEEAAFRVIAYRVDYRPPALIAMAEDSHEACECLERALLLVISQKSARSECRKIENRKSHVLLLSRSLLLDLFLHEGDPRTLLTCKEVIESVKSVADHCGEAAHVLETISETHY